MVPGATLPGGLQVRVCIGLSRHVSDPDYLDPPDLEGFPGQTESLPGANGAYALLLPSLCLLALGCGSWLFTPWPRIDSMPPYKQPTVFKKQDVQDCF